MAEVGEGEGEAGEVVVEAGVEREVAVDGVETEAVVDGVEREVAVDGVEREAGVVKFVKLFVFCLSKIVQ